jgi:uncharacterized protein YdaU (DUF1376 family)
MTTAPDKLPWFPFYVMDWLSSENIGDLTLEQEAVYLRLLGHQWIARDGYLTNNETTLAEWSRLNNGRWRKVGKPVLQRGFTRRPSGRYCNKKLRRLWHDAKAKHEQTKKAALKRWWAEKKAATARKPRKRRS